ncbi:unnamed protein product [Chironomus riparius]|uniref:Uncharacterized protein n=1 Tax=Chironomus riparius TaxID=315576 RepID=A0A9N9WLU5_9DIPT|nr:unnamed protein product [Chironomus riparius]
MKIALMNISYLGQLGSITLIIIHTFRHNLLAAK